MMRSLTESSRPSLGPPTSNGEIPPVAATVSARFSGRRLGWLLAGGGTLGWVAAFTLLVEKIALVEDPDYIPTCSINPVLSCGSIMSTPQAEAFGFPNPILGVAGFAVVFTVGVAMLAGAAFQRWFWVGLQLGVTFGVVFIHWLIFQSLYRIGALCPYCMVVWAVTIPIAWYVTLRNAALMGHERLKRLASAATTYHGVVLTVWFLGITGLVAQRFWDYWVTVLP